MKEAILTAEIKYLEQREQQRKLNKGKKPKYNDIIVTKFEKVVEYKDGCKIEKRVAKKVNLTKKINETAKLVKTEAVSAEDKLKELEKIFTK